eukprot:102206_1
MDAAFLFAYAIGLYISGYIGDLFDATKVLSCGLFATGIIIFIFGSSFPYFHIHHNYYYILLWTCNGFIQSTGWPTCVKIMGRWFGDSHSGFIFGIWSANAATGNIIGATMVSMVHANGYNDEWMFYLPAFQLILCSLCVRLCIRTEPSQWGITNHDAQRYEPAQPQVSSMWNVQLVKDVDSIGPAIHTHLDEPLLSAQRPVAPIHDESASVESISVPTPNVKFVDALCLPNVVTYALCYAFLKSVNYTMFFWLPYFLDGVFSETVSDNISIVYNIGQIFGGWACGWIGDYLHRRAPPVFLFLLIAVPPVFLLRVQSTSMLFFAILSFMAGFFIGGPAVIISSAISTDLGRHKSLIGNTAALATVAGIIDGTGSFGAAICQFVVSWLSDISWDLVFVVLTVLLLSSALLLLRLTIKEVRMLFKYGRKDSNQIEKDYGIQAMDDQ